MKELSICPNGSDGASFSLSGLGDGAPTPEAAIAAGASFPDGTPTDGYQLVDTPRVSVGGNQRLYAHVDGNRLVAVVSVVPVGSGWAVDSVAKCH